MLLHICLLHVLVGPRRHSYRMAVLLEMLLALVLGRHLLGWQTVRVHWRRSLVLSWWVSIVRKLSRSRLLVHSVNIRIVHGRIRHIRKPSILRARGWRRWRCTMLLGA